MGIRVRRAGLQILRERGNLSDFRCVAEKRCGLDFPEFSDCTQCDFVELEDEGW